MFLVFQWLRYQQIEFPSCFENMMIVQGGVQCVCACVRVCACVCEYLCLGVGEWVWVWVGACVCESNGTHAHKKNETYRVAKTHRMPYFYRSFSAKEPYK